MKNDFLIGSLCLWGYNAPAQNYNGFVIPIRICSRLLDDDSESWYCEIFKVKTQDFCVALYDSLTKID